MAFAASGASTRNHEHTETGADKKAPLIASTQRTMLIPNAASAAR